MFWGKNVEMYGRHKAPVKSESALLFENIHRVQFTQLSFLPLFTELSCDCCSLQNKFFWSKSVKQCRQLTSETLFYVEIFVYFQLSQTLSENTNGNFQFVDVLLIR